MPRLVPDRVIFDLIDRTYAAGCDPKQWSNLAAGVQAALPDTSFSLRLSLSKTELAVYSSTAGIPDEYLSSYFAYYQYINPYISMFQRFPVGEVQTLSKFMNTAEIRKQAFYHEWLKPVGDLTYGAGVTLLRDCERLLCISIDIPDRLGHLEPVAADFLRKISPHVTRAFHLNERLQAEAVSRQALEGLMERLEGAAFVISKEGRVLALNREAEDLARKNTVFGIRAGQRLTFSISKNDEAYRAALAAALDPWKGTSTASIAIDCGRLGRRAATMLPLRPSGNANAEDGNNLALLLIYAPERAATPAQLLQSLYSLTKAEAEVALRTASGSGPSEIADSLMLSRVTIRNQLAAAMGKLGVHSQAQVAALVAAHCPHLKVG